jgi:hypothetical protein
MTAAEASVAKAPPIDPSPPSPFGRRPPLAERHGKVEHALSGAVTCAMLFAADNDVISDPTLRAAAETLLSAAKRLQRQRAALARAVEAARRKQGSP